MAEKTMEPTVEVSNEVAKPSSRYWAEHPARFKSKEPQVASKRVQVVEIPYHPGMEEKVREFNAREGKSRNPEDQERINQQINKEIAESYARHNVTGVRSHVGERFAMPEGYVLPAMRKSQPEQKSEQRSGVVNRLISFLRGVKS